MKAPDGGPAFPTQEVYRVKGITVRDWFAGKALMGLLSTEHDCSFEEIAHDCYQYADAMLKRRKEG